MTKSGVKLLFWVEVITTKRKGKGKLSYAVQICRKQVLKQNRKNISLIVCRLSIMFSAHSAIK